MNKKERNILLIIFIIILLVWRRKTQKVAEDDGRLFHWHYAEFCDTNGCPRGLSGSCSPCPEGQTHMFNWVEESMFDNMGDGRLSLCSLTQDAECTSLAECEAKYQAKRWSGSPYFVDPDAKISSSHHTYWLDENGIPYDKCGSWYGWEVADALGIDIP